MRVVVRRNNNRLKYLTIGAGTLPLMVMEDFKVLSVGDVTNFLYGILVLMIKHFQNYIKIPA